LSDALLLLWISFVGTLFPPINPDAAVVIYVAVRGHAPLPGALIALAGQVAMLLVLHAAGGHLRARWPWLDRRCNRVELRWGARLRTHTLPVVLLSGLIGIPPSVPTVMLASALRLPVRHYFPVFLLGRAGWFVGLAFTGFAFAG
jgi:membrane protein YqaA with SNARE-associated domain